MLKYEVRHELKYWLSRWPIYFYAFVFISLAGLIFAGSLGLFDPVSATSQSLEIWLNSSAKINEILLSYHKVMLILLPMVVGASLYKDYRHEAHQIIYSYPLRKFDYLAGRFFATLVIMIGVSLLVTLSLVGVEHVSGLNPRLLGPFSMQSYLQTIIWYIIPNWVFLGLLTMAVVMLSRKIISAYLVILLPVLIQLITENALAGHPYLIALFDPFAQNVAGYYQQDWDINTINTTSLPVTSLLLINRCLWLVMGFLVFIYAFKRFEFASGLASRKRKSAFSAEQNTYQRTTYEVVPFEVDFSYRFWLKSLFKTAKISFLQIVSHLIFWIIAGLGLLSVVFIMFRVTRLEDFIVIPATQLLIGSPLIIYSIIVMLMTIIFAGMLVNKESESGIDALLESTPVPIYILGLGKLMGLMKAQLVLLLLFGLTGVLFQISTGYFEIQSGVYLQALFLYALLPLATWALVSVAIHIMVQRLYLGIFILTLGWLGVQGLASVGVETYLLRFNEMPKMTYSEFTGFGFFEKAYFIVGGYWLSFGLFVLVFAVRSYRMANTVGLRERLTGLRSKSGFIFSFLPLTAMILLGSIIFRGEEHERIQSGPNFSFEEFQKDLAPYKHLQQPKIVSLQATLEIYPEEQSFQCKGYYMLVNPATSPIDTVLIKSGFDEHTILELNIPNKVVRENLYMQTRLIVLNRALNPGDSMKLNFHITSSSNTLFRQNSNVLKNGSLVRHDIFPRLGYVFDEEMPHPDSSTLNRYRHYQSLDADRLVIDLTVGTSLEQVAVAPGRLVESWKTDHRAYFRYKTQPTKFSFGITSAAYFKETREWNGRNIECYYLHDRTLPSMIDGIKAAILFGEGHFGDYPHDVIRLAEFPISEGTFATAYSNTLMISEARFLSQNKKSKVDLAFYVSAHETLHHWWGNELTPAYAKGATVLTESITEYLMLRLLQDYKGVNEMNGFFDKQKERYEAGKRRYNKEEPPLILASPDDQFITYGKGAINLFLLSEVIGADRFDEMLSDFFQIYSTSELYPTTYDFVEFLERQVSKDEIQWVQKYLQEV